MRDRIEGSLKQFLPAACTFAVIFQLFRVYEFILLRGRLDADVNLAYLEFGSIRYDVAFTAALVAITLMVHLVISLFRPRFAYAVTSILFTILLILNFLSVRFFASTLAPLSIHGLKVHLVRMMIGSSASEVDWTTITPLMVLLPLAVAGFSGMKESRLMHKVSLSAMLPLVLMFNISWLFPMSPPLPRHDQNLNYYLATNKTHYLLVDVFNYARSKHNKDVEAKKPR